jgi:hypothetical protein
MADKLTAINMMRPRLELGRIIEMDQLEAFIADRSGANRAGILQILSELREALLFFNLDGRGLRIEGLGRFTPKIALDGTITYTVTPDSNILTRMSTKLYKGPIANREHIGKTPDELIAIWNEKHPEDPVV